ncbi:MAG: hypothetical protein U0791_25950 [Gemmataceae bacterium]
MNTIRLSKRSGFYSAKMDEGWWQSRYKQPKSVPSCSHEDNNWIPSSVAVPYPAYGSVTQGTAISRVKNLRKYLRKRMVRQRANILYLGLPLPVERTTQSRSDAKLRKSEIAQQEQGVYVALPESLAALAENGPEPIDLQYNPEIELLDPDSFGT